MDRRDVLKVMGTAAAAPILTAGPARATTATANGEVIKCAGYGYDRVRAIMDGQLGLEGSEVDFDVIDIYTALRAAFGPDRPYDITEIGLIPFLRKYINEDFRAYKPIPVFVSRVFRHRNIFVHKDSGIEKPEDLRGRKVATPGYASSAGTWIRGFLLDEHGVRADEMQWIETVESSDGAKLDPKLDRHFLADDFPLEKGPPGIDESDLLISGGCDAIISATTPRDFLEGNPKIQRLFGDVRSAEQDYFRTTGLFPIMHVIAIRSELIEANPQLPAEVFDMYSRAKSAAYGSLSSTTSLDVTLPWVTQEFEDTRRLMGRNFWSYGVEANRKELETVLRFTHEQGLVKSLLDLNDLFHPSTLKLVDTDA